MAKIDKRYHCEVSIVLQRCDTQRQDTQVASLSSSKLAGVKILQLERLAAVDEVHQLVAKSDLTSCYRNQKGREPHFLWARNGDENCCSALRTSMGVSSGQQFPIADDIRLAA